jgi:methylmalonyl-CoA mutase C-terminal domain/subunit
VAIRDPDEEPMSPHSPERPPKVLVTKIGFDGHDRGSRIVAAYLRDAGMEVVYTAPWQRIETVIRLALDEDVDVIGVSSLATDHLLMPKLMKALAEVGLGHIKVVVGGIVPPGDEPQLRAAGVAQIFHPGSSRDEIVGAVARLAREARHAMSGGG